MTLQLLIAHADGTESRYELVPGARIDVRPGDVLRLINPDASTTLDAVRSGADLVLDVGGGMPVVLGGFYAVAEGSASAVLSFQDAAGEQRIAGQGEPSSSVWWLPTADTLPAAQQQVVGLIEREDVLDESLIRTDSLLDEPTDDEEADDNAAPPGAGAQAQAIEIFAGASNTAPSASNLSQTVSYLEDAGPVALAPIVVSDIDTTDILTVTLRLSDATVGALSSLAGGSFDSASGVFTVSGTAAVVNATLAALVFTPAADVDRDATITVTVRDGAGSGPGAGTILLDVTPVNDAPVAQDDAFQVGNSGTATVALTTNDTDVDTGDSLRVAAIDGVAVTVGVAQTLASGATVTVNADGTLTYDPNGQFNPSPGLNATDGFSYTVVDAAGSAALANVVVTIVDTNDAPVLNVAATPLLGAVAEDAGAPVGAVGTLVSALVDLSTPAGGLDNVADIDVGAVSGIAVIAADSASGSWFFSTDNGANWSVLGTVAANNARLLAADATTRVYFQPASNFNGSLPAALTFKAWDQTSGSNGGIASDTTGGGSAAFSTASETVALVVTAVNDAPVNLVPAAVTAQEDVSLNFTGGNLVTLSDVDAGGAAIQTTLSVGNGVLSLSLTAGVTVTGGAIGSNTVSLQGTVSQLNATLSSLSYLGNADINGADSLQISTSDLGNTGGAAQTDTDTIAITVNAVNDAPVLGGTVSAAFVEDGGAVALIAGASVVDVDAANFAGGVLTVTLDTFHAGDVLSVAGGTTIGTISGGNGSSLVITLNATATAAGVATLLGQLRYANTGDNPTVGGSDPDRQVSVTLTDGGNSPAPSAGSNVLSGTVTVAGVNDAPTAVADAPSVSRDSTGQVIAVRANDIDPDGDVLTITQINGAAFTVGVAVTLVSGAEVTVNADGTVTYDPNGAFAGLAPGTSAPDSFTYEVTDAGGQSSTATVNVTVTTNFAPVANADSYLAGANENAVFNVADGGTDLIANDTDVDGPSALVAVAAVVTSAQGATVTINANGSFSFDPTGSAALQALGAGQTVDDTFTYQVTDGVGGGGPTTGTATVRVSGLNDAPVLNTSVGMILTTIDEDATTNAGQTVASLLATGSGGNPLTDVDTGAVEGIAITALSGSGTWQFSTNGGGLFSAIGAVSATSALLLRSTDLVRYVPNAQNGETATVSFKGWDQTSGTFGTKVTTATSGGTSAFSTASATANLTVTSVNDAPTATNLTSTATYTEGAATVALTDIVVSDVDTGETITATLTLSNPAAGALTTSGTAVYTAGTGVWTITGTVAQVNTALAAVAFVPVAENDLDATIATQIRDALNAGPVNGVITLDVTPVNDAPVLNNTVAMTLTTVDENATSNAGQTVASLLATGAGGDPLTDVDTGAVEGIAITAFTGSGTWQFSTNGGGLFSAIGAVSASSALLLRATDLVRYVPNGNNGETATVTFKGWDQTSGTFGTKVTTVSAGGATAFSVANATANLTVTSVNDAPVLAAASPSLGTTNENTTTAGLLVSTVLGATQTDVDTGAVQGIAITALVGNGTWEFSTNGGGSFAAIGAVSANSALLLRSTDLVRYIPDNANGESASLSWRAWDQSGATAGQQGTKVDASSTGGTTPFSTGQNNGTLTVTSVNDAPTASNLTQTATYTEGDASVALADIVVADVDTGDTITATLTLSNTAAGTLTTSGTATYTAGTGVWTITGTVAQVNAALAAVAFVPATNNDVDATIATQVRDAAASGPVNGVITLDVTPVNDQPTAVADNASVNRSSTVNVAVRANDIEPDTGDTLTITQINGAGFTVGVAVTLGSGALLTVNANGTVTYDPNGVFAGLVAPATAADSFSYTVSDTAGTTSTANVNLTITSNFAPVANADSYLAGVNENAVFNVADGGTDLIANDTDVDGPSALVAVAAVVTSAQGATVTINANGSFSFDPTGSAALQALGAGQTVDDTFTYQVTDGVGGGGPTTGTATVRVSGLNDAPVLNTSVAMTLTTIDEDATTNAGQTVASLLATGAGGNPLTDVDTGALEGIAITALSGSGTWQFSTNGGGLFSAIGTVSATSALLLRSTDLVRYIPNAQNGETATISFTGWDQTSGTFGTKVTTATSGGTSAFSTASATANLTVTSVNDAPTATNLTSTATYAEGVASVALTDIVVSDVDTGETITATLTLSNPAAGSLTTSGTATYTAGTGVWTITGTVAQVNTALAAVAFVPVTENDLDATITTQIRDAASAGPVNGVITLDVTPANDAPVLTAAAPNLGTTDEDTTIAGVTVATILGANLTDVDSGAVEGIAITSLTGNGTWQFSINGGGSFSNIGAVTGSSALLLRAEDLVRYIPNGQNGETASFTFRGWDQSGATANQQGTKTSVLTNGAATPFSTGADTASLTVTSVNDAPTATNLTVTTIYTEGTASVPLSDIVVSDVDTGDTITATLTLADTAAGTLTTSGTATYTAGTGVWTITGTVTQVNTALAAVAFVPLTQYDLDTSIAVQIRDTAGTGPDGTITLDVTAVNDAPTATNLTQTASYTEGDASIALADIVVSDVDTGETITATLTLANTAAGSLTTSGTATYTAGTGVWTITGTVAQVNAALAAVAFVPGAEFDLDTTITTQIRDAAATGPTNGVITLDVTAVNDQPLATNLSQSLNYTEGAASVDLTNIVVSDVDSGETITATLTLALPAAGSLTTSGTATYTAGTGVWTITGTVAQVNTALAAVAFVPATNNDVDTSITTRIRDAAGTGPADGSISLTVAAVNDPPTATNLTSTATYTEGAASVALTDIVVTEVDTGDTITATLTLSDPAVGSLTTSGTATYTAGTGVWTITGTATQVNTALAAVAFVPLTENDVDATIATQIRDLAGTGPVNGVITLDVTAVNDAPVLVAATPNLGTTDEDTTTAAITVSTILGANLSDVDTGAVEGIAITALTGNGIWQFSIDGGAFQAVGTVSAAQSLLLKATDRIRYVPDAANAETPTITFRGWDQSNGAGLAGTKVSTASTGAATPYSAVSDTASLTVTVLNDAPIATNLTSTATYTEGAANVALTDIVVTEVDTGDTITATLTLSDPAVGSLTTSGTATYTAGTGVWTITGTATQVNTALAAVAFVPLTENDVDATIATQIRDGAGTGPVNGVITLDVTAVNDAPVLVAATPNLGTTDEDTITAAITVSTILGANLSDVDTGAVEGIAITALTGNGTWQFSIDGGAFQAVGTVSTAQSLLLKSTDRLRYVPDAANAETPTVSFRGWDQSNGAGLAGTKLSTASTGAATPYSAVSDTASLTVTAINDAPDVVAPLVIGTSSSPVNIGGGQITVSDVDVAAGNMVLTLTSDLVTSTITFSVTAGLTVGNNGTSVVTLTGTRANIQNALNGSVLYGFSTDSLITISVDDGGNTGPGGALQDSTVLAVNFNDPPQITNISGDTLSYDEGQGAVVIDQGTLITITDADSANFDTGTLTVRITAGGDAAEDVLGVTGAGAITVGAGTVSDGGTQFATFTGGSGGASLVFTFDADATAARVSALSRLITYTNTDNAQPTTSARTVEYVVTDGDGGSSTAVTATVNVNRLNDAPTMTLPTVAPTFVEDGTAVRIQTGANAVDAELDAANNYAGASLTVGRQGADNPDDTFGIDASGATFNISGGNLRVGSSVFATFATGLGTITINFTSSGTAATSALVDEVAQRITYANASNTPPTSVVLDWNLSDGNAGVQGTPASPANVTVSSTVNITANNDAPVFTNLGGTVAFIEDGSAAVLDGNVDIADAELDALNGGAGNYGGAFLTVARQTSANAQDSFSFDLSGASFTLSGSNLQSAGLTFATFSNTAGTLTVNFTSSGTVATAALAEEVLRRVAYSNTSAAPPASVTLTWTLNDGNALAAQGAGGARSATGTSSVNITPANDSPNIVAAFSSLSNVAATAAGPVNGAVPAGATLVSALLAGGGIVDPDGATSLGVAVVGANTTIGTWFFSTDGGANWSNLGAPGGTSARLLFADADTYLYLDPNGSSTGAISNVLTLRAWDRSGTGSSPVTEGGTFDVSVNGGSSAFSDESGSTSINITSGGSVTPTINLTTLNGQTGFVLFGAEGSSAGSIPGGSAGFSLGAGDFNGDGLTDLLIGEPFAENNGSEGLDFGRLHVVFGTSQVKVDGVTINLPGVETVGFDLGTLTGSRGFDIRGTTLDDMVGIRAAGGDIDGDGFDDVIAGARGLYDQVPPVFVLNGDTNATLAALPGVSTGSFLTSSLNGTNGFRMNGANVGVPGEPNRATVAATGHVNADANADMLIGETWPLFGEPTDSGDAYLVFGAASTALNNLQLGTNAGVMKFSGPSGSRAGASVAMGDIDNDGLDDLIIGAPGNPFGMIPPNSGPAGRVYVIFGSAIADAVANQAANGNTNASLPGIFTSAGFNLASLHGDTDITNDGIIDGFTILGDSEPFSIDRAGYSVASADVNGDGFDEVIVGAPSYPGYAGAVHVVFGKASGFVDIRTSTMNAASGFTITGTGGNFGAAVAASATFNGDGFADIVVGAPSFGASGSDGQAYIIFGSAAPGSTVVSGLNGSNGIVLTGRGAGRTGSSVAGVGDFNGDGLGDILVGAPDATRPVINRSDHGEAYVVFGRLTGTVHLTEGDDIYHDGSIAEQIDAGAGDDRVFGMLGDDILVGDLGNDYLDGGGGADILRAGAGDDRLIFDMSDAIVDGGAGYDALIVEGGGVAIDFSLLRNDQFTGIEKIELAGGNNVLTLDASDLLDLSPDAFFAPGSGVDQLAHVLVVLGNGTDQVRATGFGMSTSVPVPTIELNGFTMNHYTDGVSHLLIDAQIVQHISA